MVFSDVKAEQSDLNHFFSVCHVQEVIPITFLSLRQTKKVISFTFFSVIEKSDPKK